LANDFKNILLGRYSGITPNNGHTYGGAVRLYQRNDAAGTYTKLTEITLTSLGKPSMVIIFIHFNIL